MSNYFSGMDGFIWFTGVVEDRNDPDKLGRVRVRCVGYHTDNIQKIPTSDLPWAWVMMPTTSSALNGIGESPSFIVEGSWVIGFWRDPQTMQEPIIMGTLPGVPSVSPNKDKGFNDQREDPDYGPYPITIEESDTNRLARNDEDKQHTMLKSKDDAQTKEVPIANAKPIIGSSDATVDASATVDTINDTTTETKWNEPLTSDKSSKEDTTRYASKYPYNHVMETESGHIVEYDDTKNAERIQEYHKSGTFYEIDADGNKVTRIVGNNYNIVAGTDFINVKGDVNLTIDSNCKTYIKGDWDIQVDGNVNEVIKGTLTQDVTGAVSETYKAEKTENVTGLVSETYQASQTTNITGTLDLDASSEVDVDAGVINLN